jgi:septal ring factor EnvC (AmiA/AmiB activator)
MRREQRARLAGQQGPLIRLTAALQTMARRPAALAMVQPGSLDDAVHVRALLASSLPAIRARTAAVRAEVDRGNALRREADRAVAQLRSGQDDLGRRRVALAQFEQSQRRRSQSLAESAVLESDRALAFGEEARELTALEGTRQFQAGLARRLMRLPGAIPRPGDPPPAAAPASRYRLPVEGRLTAGTGEISDAGVHARGLTFATRTGAEVVAPRSGRVVYARRFGGYGVVVIVDHGGGWTSTLTHLSVADVAEGATVRQGERLGKAGETVGVELRLDARPVPIALFL